MVRLAGGKYLHRAGLPNRLARLAEKHLSRSTLERSAHDPVRDAETVRACGRARARVCACARVRVCGRLCACACRSACGSTLGRSAHDPVRDAETVRACVCARVRVCRCARVRVGQRVLGSAEDHGAWHSVPSCCACGRLGLRAFVLCVRVDGTACPRVVRAGGRDCVCLGIRSRSLRACVSGRGLAEREGVYICIYA